MNKDQRALYDAVLDSLRQEPEKWTRDRYRAEHPSGISVWVANGYTGLAIQRGFAEVMGGVTFLSAFFGPLIPWRRAIRDAAMDIPSPSPISRADLARQTLAQFTAA